MRAAPLERVRPRRRLVATATLRRNLDFSFFSDFARTREGDTMSIGLTPDRDRLRRAVTSRRFR
jgi:hypothetical protein